MDGGAWWATVHGDAKSWTQLSDFTFTFNRYVVVFHIFLICSFLMTNKLEYLSSVFICHRYIFGVLSRYLAHVLNRLFVFLLLDFKHSSCILDNSPLSDMAFSNISFWYVACLLSLLTLSFREQKFLILIKSSLSFFFSKMDCAFGVISKKSSPNPGSSLVAQMIKNLPTKAGDPGSIPGSGTSLRGESGNPLLPFLVLLHLDGLPIQY